MTENSVKEIFTAIPVKPDVWSPQPAAHRRRSIIRDFSLNTSAHGIPGIARSTTVRSRLFWTISTLAFSGIMIYFVSESILSYFGYPTQTSVSIEVERTQSFPAVSVCNISPVRFDNFIGPFLNFTNSRNWTNTNDTSTISFQQSGYIRDFFQNILDTGGLSNYFFPLESMLISCMYNDRRCTSTDFLSFFSSTYGLCYTFNAKMKSNGAAVRTTTDNGGVGKLDLRFYVHSHEYVPYIAEDASAGMIAMIHDNTELPLIELGGVTFEPGRKYKINYKKKIHTLLPSPYSQCTTNIPPAMQAMFDMYGGADYSYSQVICYMLCVQAYVYDQCGCVNPYEWSARSIVLPGTNEIIQSSVCNITDPCFASASDRISSNDSIWNKYCSNCFEQCSTTDFSVTVSAVSAPSTIFLYPIKQFVESSNMTLPMNWSTTWQSEIKNNYVALQVICETSRSETYSDDASMSFSDLISNIGGQSGLWIGISFLSIMELVEMLCRILLYHCRALTRYLRRIYPK